MARILIIDDDDDIREIFEKFLKNAGYEVDAASDGVQGTQLYRSQPYDLVITDIIMPEKEGIETIIELRKDFPDVKIIAISGGSAGSDSYLESAKKFGALHTFLKPFSREEMLTIIQKYID